MSKVERKFKKQNASTDSFYLNYETPKVKEPAFYMVLNRPINPYYDYMFKKTLEHIELDNAYRILKIETIIEQVVQQFKTLPQVEIVKALVDFKAAVDPLWIVQHMSGLSVLHHADKPKLVGCKLGTYISLSQHRIFILNRESTEEELEIQFMGLCWLAHYGAEDTGRDVIVSKCAYKKYQTMFAGLYFIEMLKLHPVFIENKWDQLIGMQQITILSNKFGNIVPPTVKMLSNEHIEHFPYWSQLFA